MLGSMPGQTIWAAQIDEIRRSKRWQMANATQQL